MNNLKYYFNNNYVVRGEQQQLSEQIADDEAIVYEREDRIRQIEVKLTSHFTNS